MNMLKEYVYSKLHICQAVKLQNFLGLRDISYGRSQILDPIVFQERDLFWTPCIWLNIIFLIISKPPLLPMSQMGKVITDRDKCKMTWNIVDWILSYMIILKPMFDWQIVRNCVHHGSMFDKYLCVSFGWAYSPFLNKTDSSGAN